MIALSHKINSLVFGFKELIFITLTQTDRL